MMRKLSVSQSNCHTILVVDDQDEALTSVRQLLEREGHRVLTAVSGERALTLLKEHEVHLMLVDYFMPRMTGEELVRRIRQFDPYMQIILQTGFSGDKPPRRTLADLDIQGYHDKSEGPDKLLLWVDVGLKAYRLIRQLRERERLQAELVANVSHEFRTPLAIIHGYSELLCNEMVGPLPQIAIAPLKSIEQSAQRLSFLVTDFLLYAKAEARVLEVDTRGEPLEAIVADMIELADVELRGRNVRFQSDVRVALETLVPDGTKVRAVVRNLLTNAFKFTTDGEVVLRIDETDSDVRFTVEDTGPGIDPRDVESIFQPFRQLDGSMTRQHPGIGLGLALSRKLARVLGGSIEVDGRPGQGSRFSFVLPHGLVRSANAEAA
ncbi:MAG TPA: hybrid sensor histidine kinase/response regulator [Candidatus Acidoferrales bacterium]|nr:hybrid sensor histidine kinase/response regulator [Candidatus Acidoferrales bacterium]